ncbi:MAG: hypothetical protein NWQ38_07495 [Cellulophaga sp.]|nr:hypothetical protein [Cellulophaga sp.]
MHKTAEDNIPNPNFDINAKSRLNISKLDRNIDIPTTIPPVSLSLELN